MLAKERPDIFIRGRVEDTLKNIDLLTTVVEPPKFERFTLSKYVEGKFSLIKEWFFNECIPNKIRRKALILFSTERSMGKTTFAKNVVGGEEPFFIICRNNFNSVSFDKPFAKLLILDDMNYING